MSELETYTDCVLVQYRIFYAELQLWTFNKINFGVNGGGIIGTKEYVNKEMG